MSRLTFVNLPTQDLDKTKEFFTAVGFDFNEQFSDDNTICMVISDQAYVMWHRQRVFESYAERPAADPAQARETLMGLSAESRDDVDDLIAKVTAAGGTAGERVEQGPMSMQAFDDLDGHRWSVTYLDMSAIEE